MNERVAVVSYWYELVSGAAWLPLKAAHFTAALQSYASVTQLLCCFLVRMLQSSVALYDVQLSHSLCKLLVLR